MIKHDRKKAVICASLNTTKNHLTKMINGEYKHQVERDAILDFCVNYIDYCLTLIGDLET